MWRTQRIHRAVVRDLDSGIRVKLQHDGIAVVGQEMAEGGRRLRALDGHPEMIDVPARERDGIADLIGRVFDLHRVVSDPKGSAEPGPEVGHAAIDVGDRLSELGTAPFVRG